MSTNTNTSQKQAALSHILQVLATKSSKGIMYTTAILGLASFIPGIQLPSELGPIAGILGIDALNNIIDRVAHDNKMSDEEIEQRIVEVLAQNNENLLTEKEFYHAVVRLLREQESLCTQNTLILQTLEHIKNSISRLQERGIDTYLTTIPTMPQFYFHHPYPLQKNFTGRDPERLQLHKWLENNTAPVFVLVSIGGMGKSSLTWYWLQNYINTEMVKGVVWWSFQDDESSFSIFLNHAITYFSNKTLNPAFFPTDYDKECALITLLQDQKALIVLDGFEQQLWSNAGLDISPQNNKAVDESMRGRSCISPNASRFLKDIASGITKAKVLVTTRLMIHDLEDPTSLPLSGCHKEILNPLSSTDALSFMRAQGVSKGTRAELISVCRSYGFHPLSLRLLSGIVARSRRILGDISSASDPSIQTELINQQQILKESYDTLPIQLQKLVSSISAFRSPIKYEELMIFSENSSELEFEIALEELINRGMLSFSESTNTFELHPVIRIYAYERLHDKQHVHKLLYSYFLTIPIQGKLNSVEEIKPIIEILFHSLGANLYEEAFKTYRFNQMNYALRYWGYHELAISLITPMLDACQRGNWNATPYQRAWLLNEKGVQLMFLGKLLDAERSFTSSIQWYTLNNNIELQANGWMNISYVRSEMGNFQEALKALETSKSLAGQIGLSNMVRYSVSSGRYHIMLGYFDIALSELEHAIEETVNKGDHRAESTARLSRGEYYLREYQINNAMADFNRVLVLSKMNQQKDYEGRALIGLADCYRVSDLKKARRMLDEAKYIVNQTGFQDVETLLWVSLAKLAAAQGVKLEAQSCAIKALEIAERCGYRIQAAESLLLLSRYDATRSGARDIIRRAADIAEITQHYWISLEVRRALQER